MKLETFGFIIAILGHEDCGRVNFAAVNPFPWSAIGKVVAAVKVVGRAAAVTPTVGVI